MKSKNKKNSPWISDLNHRDDQTVNTGNTNKKTIYTSFIRLQQHLALKTYYLKEHVLIPVMENFLNSRSKSELIRLLKTFSRARVVEFATFNRMSARRLAIFKYLSQEPGDDQLPYSLQCYLDDICELKEGNPLHKEGWALHKGGYASSQE